MQGVSIKDGFKMKRNQLILFLLAASVLILGLVIVIRRSSKNSSDVQQVVEMEESDKLDGVDQARVAGARAEEAADRAELSPTVNPTTPAQIQNSEETVDNIHILFYEETCPHCHDVLEWMEDNQIDEVLTVERREVYSNSIYNQQLQLAAQSCDLNSAGVPFLYTAAKDCLVGTPKITSFLGEEAGVPVE